LPQKLLRRAVKKVNNILWLRRELNDRRYKVIAVIAACLQCQQARGVRGVNKFPSDFKPQFREKKIKIFSTTADPKHQVSNKHNSSADNRAVASTAATEAAASAVFHSSYVM